MRQSFYFVVILVCIFVLSIFGYRIFNIYIADHAELKMLQEKQMQMKEGQKLDASWVATDRSCDTGKSIAQLNEAADHHNIALISLQPKNKQPCENYLLADETGVLECYPVTLLWRSSFLDGLAFMKEYQKSCMFLSRHIKLNMLKYPLMQWEVSGWTVQARGALV